MAEIIKGSVLFKHKPEDFIVEEMWGEEVCKISDDSKQLYDAPVDFGKLDVNDRRAFLTCDLEKINIDHFTLFSILYKEFGSFNDEIGYSGTKASTSKIVKNLKPDFRIFDKIGKIVEEAKISLVKSDWKTTGELMNQNHKLLQELGVSTEKLDKMCQVAVNAGAFGAKLSGAGGGDCMISLVSEDKIKKVESSIINICGEVIHVNTNI